MRCGRHAVLLAVATFVLAGCSATDDQPGNPAVYTRIQALTDCTRLQYEFDTAMDNHDAQPSGDSMRKVTLGYAKAADDRMRDLGCYG